MMVSRGLFGWSPPHIQPLTPVSEVSEPPESPSPYMDTSVEAAAAAAQMEADEGAAADAEEAEPPPAAVPFSRLFACADGLDWTLMAVGSLAAAAHGMALVVYLHFFGRSVNLLNSEYRGDVLHGNGDELFRLFKKVRLLIAYCDKRK